MAVPGGTVKPPKFTADSGEDYKPFCQACDRDDIRRPAFGFCVDCEQHLCESCFNHHKRAWQVPSRHHTLLDKVKMPQTFQTTPCHKHKKEMIKFFCQHHQSLLCSVCVTLDHTRTTCQVKYIPDISKHSLNSNEYNKSLHTMEAVIEKCRTIIEDLKEKTTASNHSLEYVLEDIQKFRKDINQRLDELEKDAEGMVKTLQKDNDARLNAAETTCGDVTTSLKMSSDHIKQLNNSKQADRLFMELRYANKLIRDNERKISQLAPHKDVKDYFFKPNPALLNCCRKQKSFGTLTSHSYHEDICVKTSQDARRCCISGMTLLTSTKLILTDYRNHSIKVVDLNNNSITDQLQLDVAPWDITLVTSDQVAVTLPSKETIQLISASSNKLSLKHKLKVEGRCSGISCYQKTLVVTFLFPGKLQVLNLNGRVLTTVTTNANGEDLFSLPYYITSNNHSFYVSDSGKGIVLKSNWQGKFTGSCSDMYAPGSIAMLEDGSILVCDSFCGKMKDISGDFLTDNVVLMHLKRPQAICWHGTNNKLYISCDSLDEKYDNFIQVFRMS